MEWDPPDTTYKDELRMDLRAKTVKLRRHTEKFHGIVFGTDFLDITAKAVATKEKKIDLDYIKFKNCVHQRIQPAVKGMAWDGRKRVNHGSEEELISKIKNSCTSTTKKQTAD